MRVSIVSMVLAGGMLALGAGGASAQSSAPGDTSWQSRTEVQATANSHFRRNAAIDRVLARTLPRPRASTVVRSCDDYGMRVATGRQAPPSQADNRCGLYLPRMREAQRQHRDGALDRSLSRGE